MLPKQMVNSIVKGTRKIVGNKLVSIVLYGSFARGDDEAESDIDLALFISSPLSREEDHALVAFFSDLWMDTDLFFSPLDIEQKKFDQWVNILPFYQNIKNEGIVLWKAA